MPPSWLWPPAQTAGHVRIRGGDLGPVENEDYVSALLRLSSGARVVLEASRVAVGEQNSYGFEVHGTGRCAVLGLRRMGQPVGTVHVGPGAGMYGASQAAAAIAMGYDDLIEARDFLHAVADGRSYGTDIRDAVRAAVALDAVIASAAGRGWIDLPMD